jgi:hypothetical protein
MVSTYIILLRCLGIPKVKLVLRGDDKKKLVGKQSKPLTIKMAESNW